MPLAQDIVLIGPMGSGKSTVAQRLAVRLQCDAVDLDQCIELDAGCSIRDQFTRDGEAAFRQRESDCLAATLGHGRIIATGGGIVLAERNRQMIASHGRCVWLDADVPTLAARLAGESGLRPLLAGADLPARLAQLDAERRPLYAALAELHLDTRHGSADDMAERIAHWIYTA